MLEIVIYGDFKVTVNSRMMQKLPQYADKKALCLLKAYQALATTTFFLADSDEIYIFPELKKYDVNLYNA